MWLVKVWDTIQKLLLALPGIIGHEGNRQGEQYDIEISARMDC